MRIINKILVAELIITMLLIIGIITYLEISRDNTIPIDENYEINTNFIVHEWGIFNKEYNCTNISVLTEPSTDPYFIKKPVIYFNSENNISDLSVKIYVQGNITYTIPRANIINNKINWLVDIVNNSIINVNNTTYDYLFYECELNITQDIKASIYDNNSKNVTFYLENIGDYPISDIFFVYGNRINQSLWNFGITTTHIDNLDSKKNISLSTLKKNDSKYETDQLLFALINAGLTEKESLDLLNYWERAFFYPTNSKSFAQIIYLIPQNIYDQLLPISITPNPNLINRVGLFFITEIPIITS